MYPMKLHLWPIILSFILIINGIVMYSSHQNGPANKSYTFGQGTSPCQQKSQSTGSFECKHNQAYALDGMVLIEHSVLTAKLVFLLYFLGMCAGINSRIFKPPRKLSLSL